MIMGLKGKLRPAGNIGAALLAVAGLQIQLVRRVRMERRNARFSSASKPPRPWLATLARRRTGIIRYLRRLIEFFFEFGHS